MMTEAEKYRLELKSATELMLRNSQLRLWLWWIIGECGVFQVSGAQNSFVYFAEGKRTIGLKLIDQLGEVSDTAFAELMLEMKKDNALRMKARELANEADKAIT